MNLPDKMKRKLRTAGVKAVYSLFAGDLLSEAHARKEFFPQDAPLPHAPSSGARIGKPSVCLVEGWLGPGGAERQLSALSVALHERGHHVRVRVQSLAGVDGYFAPHLQSRGIDVAALPPLRTKALVDFAKYGIPMSFLRHIPGSLRPSALMLATELLARPVDVVHSYCDHPNVFGSWAGILSGTPVIRCSWRSAKPVGRFYFESWMLEQYRLLARHAFIGFEANSVYAAHDYAEWIGIPQERVLVSRNGMREDWGRNVSCAERIRVRAELRIPLESPVVIYVGRLAPEKRPFDMLEVYRAITRQRADVHCIIAGADFLYADVAAALELFEPDQKRRIHLLGLRDDIPALLTAADALLLTSEIEGISNALLEAMSMGLPVVATNTGGTPEIVADGHTGYLAALGDIECMSQYLCALFDDAELRQSMGKCGQSVVNDFSMEALYERTVTSYMTALNGADCCASVPQPRFSHVLAAVCRNFGISFFGASSKSQSG
jgi:glycosyltransferase involved in cell wall biosynthesis